MKFLFTRTGVAVTLIFAAVTGFIVNGDVWGTLYLKELVPGVTIPDLTPLYSPQDLPGFFRSMGDEGRLAYITINNLDFLFIFSYSLFGVSAFGTILRYIMKDKARASRLALLGSVPGLLDAAESICFRVIVSNPFMEYGILSSLAAVFTITKFITINIAFILLLIVSIVSVMTWHRNTNRVA